MEHGETQHLAVEDNALLRHRLRQVLGRLSLSRPCRPCRCTAQRHAQRAGECEVDAVCEGRDDQPHRVSEVLAAVTEAVFHLVPRHGGASLSQDCQHGQHEHGICASTGDAIDFWEGTWYLFGVV
jgi:hypothetical protein